MPALRLSGQRVDLEGIVLDKDGVLQDFSASWLPVLHARATLLAGLLGAPELSKNFASAMGLAADGRPRPDGILAMGTAKEAQSAAACEAHRLGFSWGQAREAAAEAFFQAGQSCPVGTEALPGALQALRALKQAGFAMGLCTSDGAEGSQAFLNRHGLANCFVGVQWADGSCMGKPHPDAFQQLAKKMGFEPERLAMVGDAPADLEMGRRAGAALVVGLCSGVGSRADLSLLADHVLLDLDHLAQGICE